MHNLGKDRLLGLQKLIYGCSMFLCFCALQLQDNSKDSKEQMEKRSEVTEEKVEALSTDDNAKEAEH